MANNMSSGSEQKKIVARALMDCDESPNVISKVGDPVALCEDDGRVVISTPWGKSHYFDSWVKETNLDIIVSGRLVSVPDPGEWGDFAEMMKPYSEVDCKGEIAEAQKAKIQEYLCAMIDPNWHKSLDGMTWEGMKSSTPKKLKHASDVGSSAPVLHSEAGVDFCSGEASSSTTSMDTFDPMQFLDLENYDSKPESNAEPLEPESDV